MKHCAACGGKMEDNVQYCPHCGARVSEQDTVKDYWAERLSTAETDDSDMDWTEELEEDENLPDINEDLNPAALEAKPPQKSWRIFAGILCIFLAAAVLILGLYLPGRRKSSVAVPGAGKYLGCTGKSQDLTVTNEDDYIELYSDGSFRMRLLDEIAEGRWHLEGAHFHGMTGKREMEGTLKEGVLTFSCSDIVFLFALPEKRDSLMAENAGLTVTVPAEQTHSRDWAGDYYGTIIYSSCQGAFTSWEGSSHDVCGQILEESENLGTIALWNQDNKPGERFCMADVMLTEGTTDWGKMILRWGCFYDMEMQQGQWAVDPGKSPYSQFKNLLYVRGRYMEPENPGNTFEYELFLRPWGQSWQDVMEEDEALFFLPPGYESFYLPLIHSLKKMPDHF